MSEIQGGEAVTATGREPRREVMLIVRSPRVRKRVVGRKCSIEKALKAVTARKIEAVMLGHLIGQIDRTHIRLGDGLRYVDDGVGVVKSGHTIQGQVRLKRVVRINVVIVHC